MTLKLNLSPTWRVRMDDASAELLKLVRKIEKKVPGTLSIAKGILAFHRDIELVKYHTEIFLRAAIAGEIDEWMNGDLIFGIQDEWLCRGEPLDYSLSLLFDIHDLFKTTFSDELRQKTGAVENCISELLDAVSKAVDAELGFELVEERKMHCINYYVGEFMEASIRRRHQLDAYRVARERQELDAATGPAGAESGMRAKSL